jgi:plasmid stabilization system protein ParE
MKIEYTDVATNDLIRLRAFISEYNPLAANRIAKKLIAGIKQLSQQPKLGHPVMQAPNPEKIRDLVLGRYVVRYTLLTHTILILRIWHHKEDRDSDHAT